MGWCMAIMLPYLWSISWHVAFGADFLVHCCHQVFSDNVPSYKVWVGNSKVTAMAERSRLGLMITMWAEHDFEVCFDNGLSQIEPLDGIWKKWLAQILWHLMTPHRKIWGTESWTILNQKSLAMEAANLWKPLGIPRWRWNHKDRVLFWQLPAGILFTSIDQEPFFWFSKWDIFLLSSSIWFAV